MGQTLRNLANRLSKPCGGHLRHRPGWISSSYRSTESGDGLRTDDRTNPHVSHLRSLVRIRMRSLGGLLLFQQGVQSSHSPTLCVQLIFQATPQQARLRAIRALPRGVQRRVLSNTFRIRVDHRAQPMQSAGTLWRHGVPRIRHRCMAGPLFWHLHRESPEAEIRLTIVWIGIIKRIPLVAG